MVLDIKAEESFDIRLTRMSDSVAWNGGAQSLLGDAYLPARLYAIVVFYWKSIVFVQEPRRVTRHANDGSGRSPTI